MICFYHLEHGDHLQLCMFHHFFLLGLEGMLSCQTHPKFHHLLKLVCQIMTLFSLFHFIITLEQMTIKHSMYLWKVPLYYTESATVVFSGLKYTLEGKLCHAKCCKYFGPEGVINKISEERVEHILVSLFMTKRCISPLKYHDIYLGKQNYILSLLST